MSYHVISYHFISSRIISKNYDVPLSSNNLKGGFSVVIESGAGDNAQFPDALYESVGE